MNSASLRIHQAALRVFARTGGPTVPVSELAREAGLSRGTVYNNLDDPSGLLTSVSDLVAREFLEVVRARVAVHGDPARRIADSIRLCVRRAHDEPEWGRFIVRYAMVLPRLGDFWGRLPAEELHRGIGSGRFDILPGQVPSVCGMMGGATFGALTMVVHGHATWRETGHDTGQLLLRSVGVSSEDALALVQDDLPPLPRMTLVEGA